MLNDKKIAFIICTNNELYYTECVEYIGRLIVPDGYETDIIAIQGAESMPAAYNAAMQSSDAKYKIYLHHDVFIYQENFLSELVSVFKDNPDVGMLGMIGTDALPADAIVWNAWNVGQTYNCNHEECGTIAMGQNVNAAYTEVDAIDGMLMATQYDVPWREDLGLGWHYYDISQSLEFRRKGYKVGVPFQETPWCMHDCGCSALAKYDEIRPAMLNEYKEFFSAKYELAYRNEFFENFEQIFLKLKPEIESGKFESAVQVTKHFRGNGIHCWSNHLLCAMNLAEIYEQENRMVTEQGSFFRDATSVEEMINKYDYIKFILRRMEQGICDEQTEDLLAAIRGGVLSTEAVMCIIRHNIVHKNRLIEQINKAL